jgi:hypothetical protein
MRITPGRFALLFLLILLAAFGKVIVGTDSFYFRDFGIFGYPLAHRWTGSSFAGAVAGMAFALQGLLLNALMWPANSTQDYLGRRLGLFGNCNLLEPVATPDGFYPLYLPWQRQAWEGLFYAPPSRFPNQFADFLGITHWSSPTNPLVWQTRLTAQPWITVGQQPVFATDTVTRGQLFQPDFDPGQIVYLPPNQSFVVTARRQAEARVTKVQWAAHVVEFDVATPTATLVVIAQAWYPRWKAFMEQTEMPVIKANNAFQALQVPAGRHHVRLVYQDGIFHAGAAASFLSLMAWLFLRGFMAEGGGVAWCNRQPVQLPK